MTMKNKLFALVVMLVCAIPAMSEDMLQNAATAYEKGDYGNAIALYNKVCETQGTSAPLLANLGNAYVKAGDYGKARLCYERSIRLNPSDSEVRNNIAYIESKVQDENKADTHGKKVSVTAEDKPFFSNLRDYIVYRHTSDTWAVWAGIMFVLTCGCAAIYMFASEVLLRKIGFFGGFATLALCIVTLIFAFMGAGAAGRHDNGVIIGYKVNLRSEPDENSKANQGALNRGTLLDILQVGNNESGGAEWYKVRLNSDYIGWIKASDFEAI